VRKCKTNVQTILLTVLYHNEAPTNCHSNYGSGYCKDFHGLLFLYYLVQKIFNTCITSGTVDVMATKQIKTSLKLAMRF